MLPLRLRRHFHDPFFGNRLVWCAERLPTPPPVLLKRVAATIARDSFAMAPTRAPVNARVKDLVHDFEPIVRFIQSGRNRDRNKTV